MNKPLFDRYILTLGSILLVPELTWARPLDQRLAEIWCPVFAELSRKTPRFISSDSVVAPGGGLAALI